MSDPARILREANVIATILSARFSGSEYRESVETVTGTVVPFEKVRVAAGTE
jgi:hypothetical protein